MKGCSLLHCLISVSSVLSVKDFRLVLNTGEAEFPLKATKAADKLKFVQRFVAFFV